MLDLYLSMQSASITTNVVSLIAPDLGEVYHTGKIKLTSDAGRRL